MILSPLESALITFALLSICFAVLRAVDSLSIYYSMNELLEVKQLESDLKSSISYGESIPIDKNCMTCGKPFSLLSLITQHFSPNSCGCASSLTRIIYTTISAIIMTTSSGIIYFVSGTNSTVLFIAIFLLTFVIGVVDSKLKLIPVFSCFMLFLLLTLMAPSVGYDATTFATYSLYALVFAFFVSYLNFNDNKLGNGDVMFLAIITSFILSGTNILLLSSIFYGSIFVAAIIGSVKKAGTFALGMSLHIATAITITSIYYL